MALKIAIDCRAASRGADFGSPDQATGTGAERTYWRNLLLALADIDQENEYLLCTDRGGEGWAPTAPNFRVVARMEPSWLFLARTLPVFLAQEGVDLAHVGPFAPYRCPCDYVLTLLDTGFYRHAHLLPWRRRYLSQILLPDVARGATRVLVPSKAVEDEVSTFITLTASNVDVTPLAPAARFQPMEAEEARARVAEIWQLTEPYILAMGVGEARKNLPRVVQGLAMAGKETPHLLAMVGKPTWADPALKKAIDATGMRQRVRFLGYVADSDLPALYAAASLFVDVSLYSGAGLSAMEAVACGTPALTPADGVNPLDPRAIAAHLRSCLTEPQQAAGLLAAGQARIQGRSWQVVAHRTLYAYREALGLTE